LSIQQSRDGATVHLFQRVVQCVRNECYDREAERSDLDARVEARTLEAYERRRVAEALIASRTRWRVGRSPICSSWLAQSRSSAGYRRRLASVPRRWRRVSAALDCARNLSG
jgi:hypothetical protein